MAEGLSPAEWERLWRYLPPAWHERWQEEGEEPGLARCVAHLSQLLAAVAVYLPRAVVERGARDRPGSGVFQHGTLLFADVSGFTPMSERFSREEEERGQGTEELTGIVNSYFEVVNHIAESYGGDLLKFGGDAILSFFQGAGHAARACRAAFEMQAAMAERFARLETSLGVFPLRMSIGLGTGAVLAASLGTLDRMEYAVLGPAVQQMARAATVARAGQTVLDEATRLAAGPAVTARPTAAEGYLELQEAAPAEKVDLPPPLSPPPGPPATVLRWLLARLERMTTYLPPGLLEKLRPAPAEMGIESDHRWATTFFAGLRGANRLIQAHGPDRADESAWALNRYFVAMRGVVERYEGVVSKVGAGSGDLHLHVLFGAPRAHEDDPERAVCATLDMQDALRQVNLEVAQRLALETPPFRQTIGISTGFVFAGSIGSARRREYTVMGDEVNLAHRLMSSAGEGTILISAATAAHLSPRVVVEERPPIRVKGKSDPVRHFLVRGLAEMASAREDIQGEMVGRVEERARALAALDRAARGEGRVLVIRGEAGVGKTRLVLEVARQAARREIPLFSGQCVSFLRDTVPYLPWTEVMRGLLGVPVGGPPGEQAAALTAGMAAAGLAGWEPLVGEMLGLPVAETSLTASLDPRLRQQRLFDIVLELTAYHTRRRPLVIWLEDIQWADVASLGLLDYVARNVRRLPVLLMITHRPAGRLDERWRDLRHAVEVRLEELDEEGRSALIAQLLGVPKAPEPVVRGILARAQGNPLFIEEMARALIEAGALVREATGWRLVADPEAAGVPDTVQGILQSRLDRLPETERRVIQVASVIGHSFSMQVLEGVYPYGDLDGTLPGRLRLLSAQRFVVPADPPADYAFRHAMIQEVAYESLPHTRRRALHRAIARLIEESSMEETPERLEFVALHYYRGREWRKALTYLLMAGRKAQREYANEAAITHFRRALRAAAELGEPCREERLAAHDGLSRVLAILGRYDEALEHLEQAREIVGAAPPSQEKDRRRAELCGAFAEIFRAKGDYGTALEWLERGLEIPGITETLEGASLYLMGAAVFHRQGDNQRAREWCLRGLRVAERLGGPAGREVLARGSYLLGTILRSLGEMERAIERCQQSLALYQEQDDLLGQVQAHNNLGMVYHDQGAWTQASEHFLAAMTLAERIGYAEGQARVATNLGEVYLTQGRLEEAQEAYRSALQIAEQRGMTFGVALLHNNLGAVGVRQGEWQQAEEHLARSLALFREIGSEDFLAELYRHRAEAALGQGRMDQALEDAQRSLEYARAHQVELEEGPTWRVLGRIWQEQGELDRAEEALDRALSLAVEVGNQYEVARTRLELARLRLRQGREAAGRELARKAVRTFVELGARLDLEEAESLLGS